MKERKKWWPNIKYMQVLFQELVIKMCAKPFQADHWKGHHNTAFSKIITTYFNSKQGINCIVVGFNADDLK